MCVTETHGEANVLAAEPYPGAVEAIRAWHEAGHFIHVTSHRSTEAHAATARWLDRIGLPHDELYCSFDKVARCREIEIDVLIDDSPETLMKASDAGITPATILHPWNRDLCEEEDIVCAPDWPTLARRLEPLLRMSERPALPRRRPTAIRARCCPPIEPDRQVTDWGRSERVEGLLDATLYEFLYHYWFRCEVEGIENVPATGGALLVSNHAGALPPDAPMIAKAIKEEHSRPRPLHLTVEHFFKGYPGLAMLVNKIGGVPAHPANVHRLLCDEQQLVLVFPEGRKGTEKLYKDRYRLRRFGRGGFVEAAMRARDADRPDRRDRRRGGDADVRPGRPAPAPDQADLLPGHAAVPALRRCSAPPTCRPSSASASSSRSRPTSGASGRGTTRASSRRSPRTCGRGSRTS